MASQWIQAAHSSGRSVAALLLEALLLRFSEGRVGLSEYLDYRLHRPALSWAQKLQFGGWRLQKVLEELLVDEQSRFLSLDKLSMYALMQGLGLPVPQLRAVYGAQRTHGVPALTDAESLARYLRQHAEQPVYLKPSLGSYGRGNTLVEGVAHDHALLGDGSRVPLLDFCRGLGTAHGLGWLLQEPLVPHPAIAERCGGKISGVRVHSFLGRHGPQLLRAIFKVNTGLRDTDNFMHGQSGNALAAVDLASGRLLRVVSGVGLDQVEWTHHPRTQAELRHFQLPHWEAVRELVLEAQLAFPGFLCPGWDIALCPDGPRILEINFFGDLDLSQHAFDQGFLDATLHRLLAERGIEHLLKPGPRRWGRSPRTGRVGRRNLHWSW